MSAPCELSDELIRKLRAVRLLALDVDGVLTDGRLFLNPEGRETKVFHVHDVSGLVYWKRAGFVSALISGRESLPVRQLATEVGVDDVRLGRLDKRQILEELVLKHGVRHEEVCYVGDDLLDLVAMRSVGVPISVPQGRPEIRASSLLVTQTPAGHGAVREVIEILLKSKGLFEGVAEGLAEGGDS